MNIPWKIARDFFYADLFPSLGIKGLEEAGFFEDSATSAIDITQSKKLLCTPIHAIQQQLPTASRPCILLSTGSFCPIHQGHIDMMLAAKQTVEENGFQVVGGYLSPGHDEYINYKIKDKAIPCYERLRLIQELIYQNQLQDWLMTDPWEGLFCQVAVNFTDVIYRLQIYIQTHFEIDIPIFFVCGGDNARFSLTFLQKGHCVVVGRPSYQEKWDYYYQQFKNHPRIFFSEGDSALSSTALRETRHFKITPKKKLYLRIQDNPEEKAISQLFNSYFDEVEVVSLTKQLEDFNALTHSNIISLDALLPSTQNLAISRLYDLFGLHKISYTNRPYSPSLSNQIAKIPPGNYYLFDDDIHSGNTIKTARELLTTNEKNILGSITLNLNFSTTTNEVLDARDFIIDSEENGLVVSIGVENYRVPYIYPYVCPYTRASILTPMEFSIKIWRFNYQIALESQKKVTDLSRNYQKLFTKIGFKLDCSLAEVCHWHYQYLKQLIP